MLVIGLYLTANDVIAFMIQQCVTAVVFVYELFMLFFLHERDFISRLECICR